jgi:rhomboid protease GluP
MNSWVLFDLGAQVEDIFGTQRYLVIYFFSTAAGFYASLQWTPALSMGASAALCGLIGAMMAYAKRTGQTMVWSFYMRWIIMIAVIGLIVPVIDNAAHFGGFAAGFVIGYLAGTPGANRDVETLWSAAATATVVMVGACILMQYRILAQALASLR